MYTCTLVCIIEAGSNTQLSACVLARSINIVKFSLGSEPPVVQQMAVDSHKSSASEVSPQRSSSGCRKSPGCRLRPSHAPQWCSTAQLSVKGAT